DVHDARSGRAVARSRVGARLGARRKLGGARRLALGGQRRLQELRRGATAGQARLCLFHQQRQRAVAARSDRRARPRRDASGVPGARLPAAAGREARALIILRSIVTMAALLLAGSCGGTPEGPTNPDPAVATFTSAHFAFRY